MGISYPGELMTEDRQGIEDPRECLMKRETLVWIKADQQPLDAQF